MAIASVGFDLPDGVAILLTALAGGLWAGFRSAREVRENGHPAYPIWVRILWILAGACALAGIAAIYRISPVMAAEYVALMGLLLTVAITDAARFIIPNRYVVAALAIWAVFYLAKVSILPLMGAGLPETLPLAGQLLAEALVGAVVTAGPVLVLTLIMGAAGKQAMGGGDIKLLAAVGLFFGWQQDLLALLFACMVAVAMGLVRKARTGQSTMAFGAAIAAGWLLMLVVSDPFTALLWL